MLAFKEISLLLLSNVKLMKTIDTFTSTRKQILVRLLLNCFFAEVETSTWYVGCYVRKDGDTNIDTVVPLTPSTCSKWCSQAGYVLKDYSRVLRKCAAGCGYCQLATKFSI